MDGSNRWAKRDDELSFGVSGSKLRKLTSLLDQAEADAVGGLVVLGSVNSNNVLGLALLGGERGFRVHAVLRQSRPTGLPDVLLRIIEEVLGAERVTVIPRDSWEMTAEACAETLRRELERTAGARFMIVPEAGAHPWAVPGAMTLAWDILRNERDLGLSFHEVFVEAGSGLGALGLATGMALSGRQITVKALCTAVRAAELRATWDSWQEWVSGVRQHDVQLLTVDADPEVSPQDWLPVREALREGMRRDGMLLDPFYSGRLYEWMIGSAGTGHATRLFVHSGGAIGLLSYLEWASEPVPGQHRR